MGMKMLGKYIFISFFFLSAKRGQSPIIFSCFIVENKVKIDRKEMKIDVGHTSKFSLFK
jgi:hypothetical protein